MERPLLALTRSARPLGPSPETTAAQNMRQLVQLRWLAVAGQLATILIVHFGMGVALPLVPMLTTLAALALANIAIDHAARRFAITDTAILLALLLDVAALSTQLDLAGGATNPFVSLYLVQVVLAVILLDVTRVWLVLSATMIAYATISLSYRPLDLPLALQTDSERLYLLGDWLGFVLAAVLLLLFIARIRRILRARDVYLADLRQHAAEEAAIVRMGLFASSAAHALGSPLGSLSVILSDWQRADAVRADPELSEELGEMQAEVGRCKQIVTDILAVAGAPRDEMLKRERADKLLDEIVGDWRMRHPVVTLSWAIEGLGDTMLIVDPALRQAIWNLLDNAAEASPHAVAIEASATESAVAIAVCDEGPGFPADILKAIGQPGQSTKGAGHGVGLFLAMAVARRLGGRLEAANRSGGGAEVRLVLPSAGLAGIGAP